MVCAVAFLAVLLSAMPSAEAGGASMASDRDQYTAGDVVTLIGYTSSYFANEVGAIVSGAVTVPTMRVFRTFEGRDGWMPMGIAGAPLVEATGHAGHLAYRVTFAFRLPADAPPGNYTMQFQDRGVGDLIGAQFTVGPTNRDTPAVREWAFNEPAITGLLDDHQIAAFPLGVRVGDLRRGIVPATDAWLRQPVRWPIPVTDLPADAFVPTGPEPPATTVPVAPTTVAVTTVPVTTIAPTTIAIPASSAPIDETNAGGHTLIVVAVAVAASLCVVVFVALRRRRSTSSMFLAQSVRYGPPDCAENTDAAAAADHDADEVVTVS